MWELRQNVQNPNLIIALVRGGCCGCGGCCCDSGRSSRLRGACPWLARRCQLRHGCVAALAPLVHPFHSTSLLTLLSSPQVGNKCDLADEARQVPEADARAYAGAHGWGWASSL